MMMANCVSVSMFDLVHIMDGGELMVMVELDMLMNMTEFSEYSYVCFMQLSHRNSGMLVL